MIITVAVPVPLYRNFDYLPNDNTDTKSIQKGIRVLVPFAGRSLVGIIISIQSKPTDSEPSEHSTSKKKNIKLKHIFSVLDDTPSFSPNLLSLIHWASKYYCHPIGDCLSTALPTALRRTQHIKNQSIYTVTKWHRTEKNFEGRKNASKQLAILDFVSGQEHGVWQETLKSMDYQTPTLKKLQKAGYLHAEELDPLSASAQKNSTQILPTKPLNQSQKDAIEKTSSCRDQFQATLLQGVTGSGKTEVYIERVKQALSDDHQTLILIPEINLTPQTLKRFQNQLTTPIGLIHSGMSSKEKLTTWHLAKQGIAKVIIGTRSSIFTPFKNLGLIIVDEEHDSSYKQIDGFKYSARDLAVKRAHLEGCNIILGSATPSLESIYNAKTKKYQYVEMNYRAGTGQTPQMYLIDIRSRPLENGCSRPLLNKIEEELKQGNQVIIFQNRRGYSPTLMCSSCGWLAQCKHCDARLTVHSNPPQLHCHHCNYKQNIPSKCGSCQDTHLSPLGAGTERIEYGLKARFPETKVIRIDRDNIKKQSDMSQLIDEINQGDPCLLVGTQMLAKGHDFHNVTLVAIIDADASFFSSDFRAIERSAQQLIQVAGRTGRGDKPGTVLIQTRQPEHPLFEPILASDYSKVAELELEDRKYCDLPPFSKMLTIRAESDQQEESLSVLEQLKKDISAHLTSEQSVQISGPIEATIARKSGIYRSFLHFFISDTKRRSQVLHQIQPYLGKKLSNKVKLSIDIDPLDYI
jgi:primosomal protein N' (replication factor Y)